MGVHESDNNSQSNEADDPPPKRNPGGDSRKTHVVTQEKLNLIDHSK